MIKNYNLFNKYSLKVSAETMAGFGSHENLLLFMQALLGSGDMASAAARGGIPTARLAELINNDKALSKCIDLVLRSSVDCAERILYERPVNGYEELTYDEEGKCIGRKKKYCPRSLLEYLKANSPKYRPAERKKKEKAAKRPEARDFEVEAYDDT